MCTYLSAVLLAGLLLNATLGWTRADPLAGLVIAAVAAKEGREAWNGHGCCARGSAAHAIRTATGDLGVRCRGDGCGNGGGGGCCSTERHTAPQPRQIDGRSSGR